MRKMKIIAVSSIQHPTIECGAAGTCDGVTGTKDAGPALRLCWVSWDTRLNSHIKEAIPE